MKKFFFIFYRISRNIANNYTCLIFMRENLQTNVYLLSSDLHCNIKFSLQRYFRIFFKNTGSKTSTQESKFYQANRYTKTFAYLVIKIPIPIW